MADPAVEDEAIEEELAEPPGDYDALPHMLATDPATIPADRGDAGPAGVGS